MAGANKRKVASLKSGSIKANKQEGLPASKKGQGVNPADKSKKKSKKIHGLAAQDQVRNQIRNKLLLGVFFYVTIGAAVLYWRGMTILPEIPPEAVDNILGSYPEEAKKLDLPKANQKKSDDSFASKEQKNPQNISSFSGNKTEQGNVSREVEKEQFPDYEHSIQNTFSFTSYPSQPGANAKEWKEVKYNKRKDRSGVKIYVMDNFLSARECDGLIRAHDNHVQQHRAHDPIVCFSGKTTMTSYLRQTGVAWANDVTQHDFTPGTKCLNESFSSQLDGKLLWSTSTSFYPKESTFSSQYEQRVQRHTGLDPRNGGKFQVTSYEKGVGYKLHTDCTEGNANLRDRFATILVYLQDVEKGGETEFTELGVKITPRKGRAIVWNNMDSEGNCDLTSYHQATPVRKGKKYILQRWYYYENFPTLGKRLWEPELPPRSKLTPRVSCDHFESGSCRWYDEWNFDHLSD